MSDEIKKELLKRGIKLWKPPYYGVRDWDSSVKELAKTFSQQDALQYLKDFREHALEKLRGKGKLLEELQVKVLGVDALPSSQTFSPNWAESIETTSNSLKLIHINPDLTIETFSEQLSSQLQVAAIRIVHKGKTIPSGDGARWSERLASRKAMLLCLAQAELPDASKEKTRDEALIDSIRTAAGKIQSGNMLDITDSAGNLVSMTHADRLAFLTALGLHAIGQKRVDEQNLQSALVFLLQADQEWGRLNESWPNRVDNYGLLQLDICWVYLKFESIENLPDVVERLGKAENVLRKQVHSNFVTLALVQAEMGSPVPALASVFVRLFLLQGVAQHFQGNDEKAKERLDWAWALAKSLRAVSSPDVVSRLCEAVGATPFQAISALRRTNGNVDQAAEMIEMEELDAEKASEDRQKQRTYGLCKNGKDFVDLKLLAQLQTLLCLPTREGETVASGILRLSNNSLDEAIDVYQECSRDPTAVLHRVAELDQSQGVVSRKRSRFELDVDEIALASLLSIGVNDAVAREALSSNDNSVERALLWLTNQNQTSAIGNLDGGTGTDSEVADQDSSSLVGSARSVDSFSSTNEDGPPMPSQMEPNRVSLSPQEEAEQEALELLKRVLGGVLEEQDRGEGCLGNSLDEEWCYIEEYREV